MPVESFLMDRIEDSKTGEVLLKEAYGDIDPKVLQQVEVDSSYITLLTETTRKQPSIWMILQAR
jgi:hypothetical protein